MQEFSFQVFEAFSAATLLYVSINVIVLQLMRSSNRTRVYGLIAVGGAKIAGH
jgi:glutamate/aspartate transport system permease protein